MLGIEPDSSIRIEQRTGIPRSTTHRILKMFGYHPYPVQRVQKLEARDNAISVRFFRIIIVKFTENPYFSDTLLLNNE